MITDFRCRLVVALFVFVARAIGQSDPGGMPTERAPVGITAEAVSATLGFLASDALAGRDTPSAGLDEAARYLAARFEEAGLEPADGVSFFHTYSLPGQVRHHADVTVTLAGAERPLEAGRDVRLWRGDAFEYTGPCARVPLAAANGRLFWEGRPREKPLFLEVPETSPLWTEARDGTEELAPRRRRRSAGAESPIILLREGVVPAGEIEASVTTRAPEPKELRLRNVAAVLPGAAKRDEIVLFSAHYDHIGVGIPTGGDAIYNGADDDATGTTAVVLLAEAFARLVPRPARTLAFVCFSGEEKGLVGSRAFAEAPPWPLERVVANLNIEMLGRPSPEDRLKAWITGRDYSDFAAVVGPALERAGVKVVDVAMAQQLFGASDNYSLAKKGVVAHSISAGTFPHPDYHGVDDEVDRIDAEHMATVIRGLFLAGRELADRPERLAYAEQGRRRLRLDGARDDDR